MSTPPDTPRLPGHPHVRRDPNGVLWIEQTRATALAERFGTPLYVYSRASIVEAVRAYRQALAGRDHLICYAMKANSNLALLQLLAAEGCGFDIVSGGELERVLAAGGDPGSVVFSGVGKTEPEIARALEVGVRCFNVESEAEIDTLSAVAVRSGRRARVSVRVNPDVDAGTHPYISTGLKSNKFGVAHDRALAVYRRAAALPGLEIVGIDCHIGSQITDVAPYLDALDRVLDLVEALGREGIRLHHLDVGGGLGITYRDEAPPAAGALVSALLDRLDSRGASHLQLLFEPGRSIVGNAGVLLTRTVVLKGPAHDPVSPDPQGKNFCIVDAAMNDLMRPAMYGAWMGIVEAAPAAGATRATYDVVGPVCESGDWLGRDRELAVGRGSLLAVLSAGAYAMSMASNYNTRGRAAELLVDGDQAWLIREREAPRDLFRGERLLDASVLGAR
jgi:diaminopimelate decarboxylase